MGKSYSKAVSLVIITVLYSLATVVGILAFASIINWGLEHYQLPTNTLFIGLILGGLGPLLKRIDRKKIGPAAVIAFIALFALII